MEDSRVCPICDTENPSDAEHCEVCGERLMPDEGADQFAGGEVVGFAVEDSEDVDQDIEFGAGDAHESEPKLDGDSTDDAPHTDEVDGVPDAVGDARADITDEEMVMAAPADETAAMESHDDDDEFDDHEFDEDNAPVEDTAGFDLEQGDDADDQVFEPVEDDVSDAQVERESAPQSEPQEDAPEYLYSPLDGTAYARGSDEYEEGFGPNGEELVASPPDAAFDALEAEMGELGAEASGSSMDDAELAAAAAPSPAVSAEFQAAFQARRKEKPVMAPLPQPGTYTEPAVLTVYANRQPVMRLAIDMDEVLIGRRDPVADAYPDLDLTELDTDAHVSRKHAYIYRQNKNYTLYAVSNAGTQLNRDLLDLGDRRALTHGDVIVIAGKIAMKFELPNA